MPFLIRFIAQRILIFALGFLAFLGFNPDITPPTIDDINSYEEIQKEKINTVLSENLENNNSKTEQNIEEKTNFLTEKIEEDQKKIQEKIEEAANIPKISVKTGGYELADEFWKNVVVNIVCVNKSKGWIKLSTGSGVIISPSGIVLTNTHVANAFLFDDESKSGYKKCTIRRENIPTYGFNAELIYLSDKWLKENQTFFTEDSPRGNGENDFALLAITSNTNPALSVPNSFDYVPLVLNEENINEGDDIIAAAYPGVNTGVFELDSHGSLKKADTYIDELMTFYSNTIDLISTGPNSVAQRGSSGGGVFKNGSLLGIIVTTDDVGDGDYINALTLTYINRDFNNETGESLSSYVSFDKNQLIENYKDDILILKKLVANFL